MKKTLFAIAAMVAMVACSNDHVVKEAAQEAITFDNAFVDNSTRSVNDPSFDADNMFSDFAVYGFVEGAVLLDGVRVAKEDLAADQKKTGWEYEGTTYWIAGAKYNFNAVAPLTGGNWEVVKKNADNNVVTNASQTTLSFTNNGTTDLLYATATAEGEVSGNDAVAFTFRHTLSKVKFSFENAYNATNATIRVKDVKINDAYASGSVVLDDETVWTPANPTLALAFGNVATNADDNAAKVDENDKGLVLEYGDVVDSYNELFMIPGAGATVFTVDSVEKKGYTVQFTVELLVGGQEVKQYVHTIKTDFAPESGKSYDLKATINAENIDPNNEQEPIEFTVQAIDGWGNQTEQDI